MRNTQTELPTANIISLTCKSENCLNLLLSFSFVTIPSHSKIYFFHFFWKQTVLSSESKLAIVRSYTKISSMKHVFGECLCQPNRPTRKYLKSTISRITVNRITLSQSDSANSFFDQMNVKLLAKTVDHTLTIESIT